MRIASIVDNDSINSLTGFTTSVYFQGCLSIIANIVTVNRLNVSILEEMYFTLKIDK